MMYDLMQKIHIPTPSEKSTPFSQNISVNKASTLFFLINVIVIYSRHNQVKTIQK